MADVAALGLSVDSNGVVRATTDLDRFTKASNDAGTAADKVGRGASKGAEGVKKIDNASKDASRSLASLSSVATRLGATLAAAISVNKIAQAAESYVRFGNQLRVAGIEGDNLRKVQDKLLASANKYGIELNSISTLYGRISTVQKDLGASQEDMLKFTNGIAAALKVQGGSANEASGALLQMSQALGSGIIRAEEFNSILEGARPILQTVANNLDAAGGSVSKLRALVIDGKLTSQDFFQAFLRGTSQIEAQAAQSVGTVSNAFTTLQNNFTVFIGRLDETYGVSKRVAEAIILLSENLDKIAKAIGVAVAAFAAYKALMLATAAAQALASISLGQYGATVALAYRQVGILTAAQVALGGAMAGATAGARVLGSSLLAAFGGPIGVAIAAITTALGFMIYKMGEAQRSIDSVKASIDAQTESAKTLSQQQASAAAETGNLDATQKAALTGVANLTGQANLLSEAWGRVAAQAKNAALEQARAAKTEAALNFQKAKKATEAIASDRPNALRLAFANGFDEGKARAALAKQIADAKKVQDQALQNFITFRNEERRIQGERLEEYKSIPAAVEASEKKAGKARKEALSEEQKLRNQRNENTINFIKALNDEIDKIGLNEAALRALEISKAKEVATTQAQIDAIEQLNIKREEAIKKAEQQKAVEEATARLDDFRKTTIADLDIELQTMELVGVAREREVLRLQHQAEMTDLMNQIRKAEIAGNTELVAKLRELGEAYEEAYAKGQQINNIKQTKEETERLNESLRETISLLQGIGGLSGVFGGLLGGLMSGDFSGLGKIGGLFNIATRPGEYLKQAEAIGNRIEKIFGVSGAFAKTIGSVLQNAALGAGAGSILGGNRSTGGQIGGAIGGAIGGHLASSFAKSVAGTAVQASISNALGGTIGKALGSAIPVVGTILGGLVGNLVGGLFGRSHKWARADITGSTEDALRYRSNSGKYEGPVNDAAKAVIDGLKSIADQLGGVAGEFASIAIGVRDGSWRVNVNGTSLKVGSGAKDFGEDSAAAIAYAIQTAVQRGAITGINQSVLNLLQASGDFEEQLSKAAELQNIFTEIAQAADPMGYELEQLAKKFVSINSLLSEAGATQEEVDQVAAYQAQQEAAIRARYAAEAASKRATQLEKESELLALQGKASQALAKSREAELIQMDASIQAIQKQINAEQDAATKRGLQIQLLEAQGNAEAALAASRAEIIRNTLDENKALQNRIFYTQDLSAAYERETSSLNDTIESMKALGNTLRDFRKEIYGTDSATYTYTQALANLMRTGGLASTGDRDALEALPGVGRDYLDIAMKNARSAVDVARAQALVANYVDDAISYTEDTISVSEQQLDELKQMVDGLLHLDESVLSVRDAVQRLVDMNSPVAPAPGNNGSGNQSQNNDFLQRLIEGNNKLSKTMDNLLKFFRGISPNGTSIMIGNWADEPLNVVSEP